ncbi:MAG: WG repeat-containing protein [Bacteroidota bacterium]|nr:WG repeat-containing protein [Bacteroidota bacterium]
MKHFFPAFLFTFLLTASSLIAQSPVADGQWLAPACKPKTYGLNNSKGEVAAEAKFDMLEEADGTGWIAFSGGRYGVINSSGSWIIKPNYEIIVQFLNGKAVAGKKNKAKKETRQDEYFYSISKPADSTVYYGVIDASGVWIIAPDYEFVRLSDDGSVQYIDSYNKIGFLNPDGSVLIRAQYDFATRMNDGVAVIGEPDQSASAQRYTYNSNRFRAGNYFVIDRNGNKLNAAPYELIREFREGRAAFNNDGIWKGSRYSSETKLVGGKWGFLDASGKEIIAPVYDYVYDFENGKAKVRSGQRIFWIDKDGKETEAPFSKKEKAFTVFCSPGFFGYIGLDGKYVIEPQYYAAKQFSEGLAAVMPLRASDMDCDNIPEANSEDYKDMHTGYSRILNNFLNLDHDYGIDFSADRYARMLQDSMRIADSLMAIPRFYGYVDKTGNLVLPAKYEVALPFHNGRAYVLYHDKWGVIDTKGNWIFVPMLEWPGELSYISKDHGNEGRSFYKYEEDGASTWKGENAAVYSFNEGMGCIFKYDKYGFIDTTGKIIAAPVYDEVKIFSNGLAAVRHGDLWGYIDKTGKEIIPLAYFSAQNFSVEGLACVGTAPKRTDDHEADMVMEYENSEIRYFGYIDKKGNWAIKPQFTEANSFSNGLAVVNLNYQKSGYIDKTGKFVVPPKYDYAGNFANGYALVRINMYDPVYIDKTGKVSKTVTPAHPAGDKSIPLLLHYGPNGYFGFVDAKGDEKIPHEFSEAGNFSLVK